MTFGNDSKVPCLQPLVRASASRRSWTTSCGKPFVRTGLEYEVLQGRIGSASRSAINDTEAIIASLDKLKADGVDTGRVLAVSFTKAINTADGQAAIDSLRGRIEQMRKVLGDKITDGLLDQAREQGRRAEKTRWTRPRQASTACARRSNSWVSHPRQS
ncbi:hypothetical protein [Paracidovorax citrulli]|uniref:hypothetical protein n=1 Tax=Paracidovorax citrulli TaxID=80869 RepID=UPI0011C43230|nr:hypothetical protein [Paracidovorax citrulli]